MDRAAEEAVKAKRCIGALRYLWRNSPYRAHHPAVHEMKSYLKDSPIQQSNAAPAPPSDAGSDGVAPAGSDSHGGSEPQASDSDHESLPLVALGNGDDHDSDGDDGLDSDGEPRDSQRRGAWMGRVYKHQKEYNDAPEPISDIDSESHKNNDDDDDDSDNDREGGDEGGEDKNPTSNGEPGIDGEPLSEMENMLSTYPDKNDGWQEQWAARVVFKLGVEE